MRSLNLDQLKAFVEVVERGSFTAAARELNLTQPAVTHQVQELERRFQVALVERFGKRAYLTEAGEKLIEHARSLLEEDSRTQVMMRRFGDGWLGRVRVGTSMTVLMYLLPPILRQLKTDHPQLEINLKADLTTTTLQMLKTNALDLGLCALPIEDPAFETVPLFKDELVAILPAAFGHVPKTVPPAFLPRCPLILGSENSARRRAITDWLATACSGTDAERALASVKLGGASSQTRAEPKRLCAKQLGGALPLLGEFEPLMRQLFVAPLAFFLPATAR